MHTVAMAFAIAEVSQQTGLTAHTLRYYERDGLMPERIARAHSGHRRYSARDLRWLSLITGFRSTGMPIRDIKRYAALVRAGDGNERERLNLLRAHRAQVEAQLAEAISHLKVIDYKMGVYEGRVKRVDRSERTQRH